MKKKIFLSVLLVLIALTGAMAAWPDRPISLVKAPGTPKDPVPGARPRSLTEDDNFFTLEASLGDESISLSATVASFAQVTVVSESGTVVYDQLMLLGNEPTAISTEAWASGAYIIYIEIGDDLYEGEFYL